MTANATKDKNEPDRRLTRWQRRVRSIYASSGTLRKRGGTADRNREAGEAGTRNEIATDFIPVMGVYNLPAADSGQVVRVELPRSALTRFGLPMNIDRAGARIKADVVVGNDGLARAIRFVH